MLILADSLAFIDALSDVDALADSDNFLLVLADSLAWIDVLFDVDVLNDSERLLLVDSFVDNDWLAFTLSLSDVLLLILVETLFTMLVEVESLALFLVTS